MVCTQVIEHNKQTIQLQWSNHMTLNMNVKQYFTFSASNLFEWKAASLLAHQLVQRYRNQIASDGYQKIYV